MTFEPFLCKICGYVSFDGGISHKCTPRQQKVSFYSRRFSKCVNCIFNDGGVCASLLNKSDDEILIKNKIADFYDGCPNDFWLPVISKCEHCSETVVNTSDTLFKCTFCGHDLKKPKPFHKKFKTQKRLVFNPYSQSGLNLNKANSVNLSYRLLKRDKIEYYNVDKPIENELVVARYIENLDWLQQVPNNIDRITVYNKSNDPLSIEENDRIKIINLKNIGKEADTWLYHCISRRSSLANVTYLAQGHPFIHSPEYLTLISYEYDELTTLTTRYTKAHSNGKFLGGRLKDYDKIIELKDGNKVRLGMLFDSEDKFDPSSRRVGNFFSAHVHDGWKKIFRNPIPKPSYFGYAAMWAIPKKNILIRSENFYRRMINSGITAHQAEGLWYYIFQEGYPSYYD